MATGGNKGTVSVISLLVLSLTLTMTSAKDAQLEAVLKGNSEFTKKLYHALSKEEGNIFFSPISVHAVLSMLHQGSRGETQQILGDVLAVPGLTESAEGYKRVMKGLNSVKNVTLLIANKIYIGNGYAFQDNFASIISKNFLSEVQSLDFADAEYAAKVINTWVEGKTNNRIKDLIQPLDLHPVLTRLVLVNAIYFKGKWETSFNPKRTYLEKFYLNDHDSVDVQMMHLQTELMYKVDENLDAKVLELPYSNKDLSMIINLPNKRNGIAELEKKLDNVDLSTIIKNMYQAEVSVSLPKFKIETSMDLKKPLIVTGLGNIFSGSANFSGMIQSTEPIQVTKVIHKAFIEVTEEGTEAAAATAVVMNVADSVDDDPIEYFDVDHPFILMLLVKEERSTYILFHGRILQPVQ